MTKAKLFTTGGSQAVRLPAKFRFEGGASPRVWVRFVKWQLIVVGSAPGFWLGYLAQLPCYVGFA
jgi:hypothetical protein